MHVIDHTKGQPSESESRYGGRGQTVQDPSSHGQLLSCSLLGYAVEHVFFTPAVIQLFWKCMAVGTVALTSQQALWEWQ